MSIEHTIRGFLTQDGKDSLERLIAFTLLEYEH